VASLLTVLAERDIDGGGVEAAEALVRCALHEGVPRNEVGVPVGAPLAASEPLAVEHHMVDEVVVLPVRIFLVLVVRRAVSII